MASGIGQDLKESYNYSKCAVVIPAYKVSDSILSVVNTIPDWIDYIIVIDDACPESSGKIAENSGRKNLKVIYHERNLGVGGAVITGYRYALDLGCDIVIKMDGDGQMDPAYLKPLIEPLLKNNADYTKGNRFKYFSSLKEMPRLRLLGNSALSFLIKAVSGYWNIMDPTNGYTAIHQRVLKRLNLEMIAKRFFFESDMLINLNILNAVVMDIEIPSRYGTEKSNLRIRRILLDFPPRLLKGFIRRIFLKYFIYDFNMASVYIMIGLPMFLFGITLGVIEWIKSIISGEPRSAGTIMLVALPIIVSFQMLLQAVQIDISSVPKRNSG